MPGSKKGQAEFAQWMGPLLDCLRALGGSARPKEVTDWIARALRLPPEVTEATNKNNVNRFYNQVAWARQYLVWQGLLDDSKRGVWTLSPLGWKTRLDDAQSLELIINRVRVQQTIRKQATTDEGVESASPSEELVPEEAKEQALLDVLKALPPHGFELICGRLLREHGFEEVIVTQRSRDGGIDGFGLLRLSPFVSVRVAFQAKRYKDVVARPAVGEFRNAMLGRAEKGVFITTGRFTPDAQNEASRDGVIPIELIDGERLVELFQDARIGVKPKTVYEVDHAFFDAFRREA
jgi:restriction system protein